MKSETKKVPIDYLFEKLYDPDTTYATTVELAREITPPADAEGFSSGIKICPDIGVDNAHIDIMIERATVICQRLSYYLPRIIDKTKYDIFVDLHCHWTNDKVNDLYIDITLFNRAS